MDKIAKLKSSIERPATLFETEGFAEHTVEESWIGRVFVYGEQEEIPRDKDGKLMLPLAQFHLPNLPFVPQQLSSVQILTVFMSEEFPDILEDDEMGDRWFIREYGFDDKFVVKNLENPDSYLKPFPLRPKLVTDDCPLWDGGGLDREAEEEVIALEKAGVIESYYDFTTQHYNTKFGGYPSFCQSGIDFGEGFEFVFQISTDPKANLNVVDNGSFMFAKNAKTGIWRLYYDFY